MWRYLMCLMPVMAMAQVEQGAANADFTPAFESQTRAPEMARSDIRVDLFASGFDFPWGIAPLPDGRFLVTERGGAMKLVDETGTLIIEVSGLPAVAAVNQGGLLDVAISRISRATGSSIGPTPKGSVVALHWLPRAVCWRVIP